MFFPASGLTHAAQIDQPGSEPVREGVWSRKDPGEHYKSNRHKN